MEKKDFDISNIHIPRWEELPNIPLYMDQVLNYMIDSLSFLIRNEKEDILITKTMVNNYVKQNIIEPPNNKKYHKLHLAKLFVICILKQVYSIQDIKNLIDLALKTSPAEDSYNQFCSVLEESLVATFHKIPHLIDETISQEQYILKNVVQSFVSKLYVQITFL